MKKILTAILSILGLAGLAVLGLVLGGAMVPSERAKAERSQHDISHLKAGEYVVEGFNRKDLLVDIVLIIKDWDGRLFVHLLPTEDELVIMPDRWWGWGYYRCQKFGPDVDADGRLQRDGRLRCHDQDAPEWEKEKQWVWRYSGESEGAWTDDMFSPQYEIAGGTLYINR